MPRKAGPWWNSKRKTWMATHKGKQHRLPVTDPSQIEAALKEYNALLARLSSQIPSQNPVSYPGNCPLTNVVEAVEKYLKSRSGRVKPHTLNGYRWFLEQFAASVGNTPIENLTARDVERSAARGNWSPSTQHDYLGTVSTFLREMGHPLRLQRPPKQSRGADAVWTDAEFWMVYGAAKGDFKPYLLTLRDTGCRPAEAAGLTVEGIDWEHGHARLKDHKMARKGKQRILHFPAALLKVLEVQKAKYGTGFLFRGKGAKPLSASAILWRLIRARDRAGVERPITAYGLRHSWATRALEGGASNEQVAAALGNSAAMIEQHYGHLGANAKVIRELAERVANRAG